MSASSPRTSTNVRQIEHIFLRIFKCISDDIINCREHLLCLFHVLLSKYILCAHPVRNILLIPTSIRVILRLVLPIGKVSCLCVVWVNIIPCSICGPPKSHSLIHVRIALLVVELRVVLVATFLSTTIAWVEGDLTVGTTPWTCSMWNLIFSLIIHVLLFLCLLLLSESLCHCNSVFLCFSFGIFSSSLSLLLCLLPLYFNSLSIVFLLHLVLKHLLVPLLLEWIVRLDLIACQLCVVDNIRVQLEHGLKILMLISVVQSIRKFAFH